jgi:CDGSH-type Zn-finger protein
MTTKITIKNNGSIRVEGEFELFDISGKKFELAGRTSISLCRCGASNDKPFCDGSHRNCGFQSVITARELPPITPKP